MKKLRKRVLSLMLCFVLVTSCLPISTFAAENETAVTSEVTEQTAEPIQQSLEDLSVGLKGTSAPAQSIQDTPAEVSNEGTNASTEEAIESTEETGVLTEDTADSAEEVVESTEETVKSIEQAEVEVIAVSGITLNQTALEVEVGAEPITLTATVTPEDASDKTVTWTSSESGVASVDENGVVTFGYMGEAVITATAGEYSASCTVNVGEGEWSRYADDTCDYLFIATDRHTNTSIIGTMINNMESKIGENELDYLGLGGDMVGSGNDHPSYNSSTVLSEVTGATSSLSAANVDIVAGIHDMNVTDDAGIVLPYSGGGAQIYEGDRYYVYGVPESCISGAVSGVTPSEEADDFVTWANGSDIDKSKVIIVLSHYPLHQRRGDNTYAYEWVEALNTVAVGDDTTIDRDVIFFWGHNHTGESSVDTAVYHVAPGNSISVQGESGSQNIYFSYANAGYLNAKSSATLLSITDTEIKFEKYVNSSVSTTNTVTRVVTEEEEITLSSIAVTSMPTKTAYNVGDTFDSTGLVVTATYSDGTTADITEGAKLSGYDMSAAGTYTVTVTYEDKTATFEITVNEVSTELTENTVDCIDDSEQVMVEATALGLTGITATNVTGDVAEDTCDEIFTVSGYMAFDIELAGHTDGNSVAYSISVVPNLDTTNLELYYIDDEGSLIPVECEVTTDDLGNEYVEFTTTYVGTFVYGSPVVPEGYTVDSIVIENVPEDVFVGTSVDLTEAVIRVKYTMEGAEDFNRSLTIYDYDEYNFSGLDVTTTGQQTVTFTFDGGTATFVVNVWGDEFTANGVTVQVGEGEYGVTEVVVADSTNENVATAIANVIDGDNYVAYDITLTYSEGYEANEDDKTVTLPIPEGIANPVVYYVSDDGKTVTNMNATKDGNGNVTFETTHFSTYVVGESTEIEVPDPTTQTVTGATTSEEKTVYVRVDSIEAGEKYLIVSNDYALLNNSGSASSVSVTDNGKITINNTTYDGYIELDNTNAVWTAASGYTFKNGNYYLGYTTSSSGGSMGGTSYSVALSTSTSRNWTYSNDYLYVTISYGGMGSGSSSTKRYIYYGSSGWALTSNTSSGGNSSSSRIVYLYKEVTYDEVISANGTYSIAGNPAEVSKVVVNGTTVTLGSTLTFVPESGTTTTTDTSATATYTVVDGGDPNKIIDKIDGNTVTFTGTYGKALVKVSYTVTVNGTDYTVDNYITVTATAPVYDIEISQDGTTATPDIIAVRGVTDTTTLQLSYLLTYEDADGIQNLSPNSGITWYCYLPSGADASAIASIDQTGKLIFTGAEGTIKVMVSYETTSGTSVTDIITINVRKSNAVTPSESTTDFPRWPNEGAVRFDKTATAIGNFSETGIAQVELSMAGIPVKTGGDIDVVIMLDMTGSMSDDAMEAAEESAIAFAEQIVKNSDGTYNDSRICVMAFNSGNSSPYTYWELDTIDDDDEWSNFCTKVRGASDDQVSGGTPYDKALEKCQEVLATAKTDGTGNDRQQFCVFVSDGGPTSYEYITNYDAVKAGTATAYTTSTASASGGANQSDSNFATIATYTHEYYSTLMKDAGVTMYSVLTGLSAEDYPNCTTILQNIASDSSKAYVVEDGSNTTALTNAFTAIAEEINAAATNVEVEDVITPEYDLIFELPNSNIEGLPNGQEFYIEVVDYPLNEDTHERTGSSKILQRIYLSTVDGKVTISKITYTDDSGNVVEQDITPVYTEKAKDTDKAYFDASGNYYPEGNGTHHMTSGAYVVLNDDGSLKSLHAANFTYVAATRQLNWTVTSMSETSEVALRYFVYLKNSGGVEAANQVEAGTYPTNVYATLNYTNHLGTECEQIFPVPQMTWNGAQVSYVFYLVNENGVPVNRAGREVTFAEAIFVTDIYTHAIVWNDLEQSAGLEASYLASDLLPSDYRLYDTNASYNIHVYEDEVGVNLNNHFVIAGTSGDTTTYVYNNKTDVDKYNVHGTYAATSTYLCKSYSVNATVENGVITAAIYVAASGEDQVEASEMESTTGATIIDGYAYYIDENGKVYTIVQKTDATAVSGFDFANTTVAFAVMWEKKLVEDTVVVDFGLPVDIDVVSNDFVYNYVTGIGANDPNYGINTGYKTDNAALTAQELTISGHTVSVVGQNHIRFTPGSMEFNEPVEFFYETTVEVYENSQVIPSYMYSKVTVIPATTLYYEDDFLTLSSFTKTDGSWVKDTNSAWTTDGSTVGSTQEQDRPGESKISAALDADNNYGYDSAYETMSTHSLGSGAKINVNENKYATAEFTFYGTGFDVISLTSNGTGTITVLVKDADGNTVRNTVVDTYYGMEEDGTLSVNNPNTIYQVPVIKIFDLEYGKYTVKITAAYNKVFDHNSADSDSYDLYLDAIRIYDPTGNLNETANEAYVADGEAYPIYEELRDNIIAASEFTVTENGDGTVTVTVADGSENLSGSIFIDCNDTASIADYVSYGPNNELYLAKNQAIAFNVNVPENVADVQLGIKMANGSTVTYEINGISYTVETATDMYYSILEYAKAGTVTIKNVSDGILSLTNIKVTHTSAPATEAGISLLSMDAESAGVALMSLRPAVEEEVPEITVPEETEPEEELPETTEPEQTETEEDNIEEEIIKEVVKTVKEFVKKLFGWLFG